MTGTASQEARDNLITQDIRLRRAIGGQQRVILQRQRAMERRVTAAVMEIDPAGATTDLERAKRMKLLQKRVTAIANDTYAEHSVQSRRALIDVARAESFAVTGALEESV